MYYKSGFFSEVFELNNFPSFHTPSLTFSEASDQITSDIPLEESIIEIAQSNIEALKNVNFKRTSVLPASGKVSLMKTFSDFNLQFNPNLRIYVNGMNTNVRKKGTCFWEPFLTIYDSETGELLPELSKKRSKRPFYHFRIIEKSKINEKWHTYIDLDLNEIGPDKTVIFGVTSYVALELVYNTGIIFITSTDQFGKETMIFRNEFSPDQGSSKLATFFKFEFIDGAWCIVPFTNYFKKKKMFDDFLAGFCQNKRSSFDLKFSSDSSDVNEDDDLIECIQDFK